MLRHAVCVFALACLTAAGAQAVHLSDVEGSVLVNNQKVAANKDVTPGDRVKAVSGAAKIVYDNGAVVTVAAGQTVMVLQTPPDPPVQASSPKDPDNGYMAIDSGDTGLLLGGAILAGGGAAAIALTNTGHGGGGGQAPNDYPNRWKSP
jgi:hypothetical protein